MKKLLSSYQFSAIQEQLFESGKLDGLESCISDLIKRLRFAREMRALEVWCSAQDEIVKYCELLENLCMIDNVERHILYDFIMENGKRDR